MSEEHWAFTVEDTTYVVPKSQLPAIHKAVAGAGAVADKPSKFDPGDVVRLKSGGPEMTVSRVVTYPNNPYKCALIGCVWFTRANDDCPAATRYPYDGTRYTGYTGEADFPADCLERE